MRERQGRTLWAPEPNPWAFPQHIIHLRHYSFYSPNPTQPPKPPQSQVSRSRPQATSTMPHPLPQSHPNGGQGTGPSYRPEHRGAEDWCYRGNSSSSEACSCLQTPGTHYGRIRPTPLSLPTYVSTMGKIRFDWISCKVYLFPISA